MYACLCVCVCVCVCAYMYLCIWCLFSFFTDKRWLNAQPDALPALRRTPRVGEV